MTQKITNFPQNDKKMTKQIALLQVAKIAIFLEALSFFVILVQFS
jgi:hypothetical protein